MSKEIMMKAKYYINSLIFLSLFFNGCAGSDGHMGGGYMHGYGGPFMWVFWILLIAVIGAAVYFVLLKNKERESSMDILKKRYARGEISKEEFERIKDELE